MFPPRPGKKRVRGVRKPQVTFRVPSHLEALFEQKERLGYQKTEIVLDMIQVAHDLAVALGDDYYEAEKIAKIEGFSTGVIIARWAKTGMKSKK